eukprot:jgi/Chrzof1/5099/Cz15g11120.t1
MTTNDSSKRPRLSAASRHQSDPDASKQAEASPNPQEASAALKRRQIVEGLELALHQGNAGSRTAPEVLLFANGAHIPVVNWQGNIQHKLGKSVVDLCTVSLLVPELYSDQFPVTLYATEVVHRRQVSLGKHVVCRCSLGQLSERQLTVLEAMAKHQMVAIVHLQYCELHLVPYFDNNNHVRMVGFLKIYTS